MRKMLSYLICLAVVMGMGSFTYAQEEGKWSISLEPMRMEMKGLDDHVGDIFYYTEDFYEDPVTGNYTLNYGTVYDPINLNMEAKACMRGEINYRRGQWGLGFSGWWFDPYASVSGRVTTPPFEITDTGYTYYINGVRMWDHTIEPVYNELEDSYMSPVDYWAENDFYVWTLDFFVIRTLAEKEKSRIDLNFGVKMGTLDHKQNMGLSQRAYVDWSPDYIFDNHITLESTSRANYSFMAGPVIGLEGKAKYKRFGISGFINQSVLFGRVTYSGLWRDVDDILYIDPSSGETIYHDVYTGLFPFSKKESVSIPVMELQLKVTYDITENISIGSGAFFSIWWNTPVALQWSIPGDWTLNEGTGWRLREKTLKFYGVMPLLVEIRY